jgi:hypothetical protein
MGAELSMTAEERTNQEYRDLSRAKSDKLEKQAHMLKCFLINYQRENKLPRRKLRIPRSSGAIETHDVSMSPGLVSRFPLVFGLKAYMTVGNNEFMTKMVSLKELIFYNDIEAFGLPDDFDFEEFNMEVLDASYLFL